MTWSNTLSAGLEHIAAQAFNLSQDAYAGAEVILADAEVRAPKESGHLAGTGMIQQHRSGKNTVGITFDGPYARYIHEHLHFKHPHGGQAKFLETAMLVKGQEAINRAGEHFWERL
jgi:hypothetical protein